MSGSHAGDKEDWREYVEAARRKVAIARYHLECREAQNAILCTPAGTAPIPAQAHFEGVLYATNAAADQLAGAVNLGFALGLDRRHVNLGRVLQQMDESQLKEQLREWRKAAIARDVRDIRNEAAHHHYAKEARTFVVQIPKIAEPYGGPRDLIEYGSAVVAHAEKLVPILNELERELSCQR